MTLTELFTDIADAVREKGSTTDKIKATDLPTAIANIPSGSGKSMKAWFDAHPSSGGYFRGQVFLTYEILDSMISYEDTSNVTSMYAMFEDCLKLEDVPLFDTSNVTDTSYMFNRCEDFRGKIPAFDMSNVTDMTDMFKKCCGIKDIDMYGMKVSFGLSSSTRLSRDVLVKVFNNLATVSSTQTLTLGSTLLAKLSASDKAIATAKGWTLA